MSFERNQEIRTLEGLFLKMKWKIRKHEYYISVAQTKSPILLKRLKERLEIYVADHDLIWEELKRLRK